MSHAFKNGCCYIKVQEFKLHTILCPSGFSVLSANMYYEYYYIGMEKTFGEAQTYCREKFDDLATIRNREDNDRVVAVLPKQEMNVWIGLRDDMNIWNWKHRDMTFRNNRDFRKWVPGHPIRSGHGRTCVVMEPDGRWQSRACGARFPAVCFDGKRALTIWKTWTKENWNCNPTSAIITNKTNIL